ncbi:chaperonin 10-like protein [Dactylonectria estremocensis]|uniref:Chaperonin 10-like protein n=1 Tax=Dactylonectria estremocensis TaxID=1079267 RepID=A0A9P9EPM9_9HYPO|nr:chaperonin 10-like protein [Dactylonectria estremocensis]
MKALVLRPSDKTVAVEDIPIPAPGSGEVLVHVCAIALNPVDALYSADPIATQPRRVVGTDFAGVIVDAAADLAGSSDERTKPGTRVSGFLQGAASVNDRPGAFAEFLVISHDLLWVVHNTLSLEAASAISMCGLTAAQGLFTRLDLLSPFEQVESVTPVSSGNGKEVINIFIYGASTSLGLYAAQLVRSSAANSGHSVRLIGAAGASKHDFLQQGPYWYDALVAYQDSSWPEQVRAATSDGRGVQYALDCISEGMTVAQVHSTFADDVQGDRRFGVFRSPGGGGFETEGLRVQPMYGAVWEGLGVEVQYNGMVLPANPAARAFAVSFFAYLSSSERAKLQPNPLRLMPGGLERVAPDGFQLLGSDKVSDRAAREQRTEEWMRPISGEKLVYSLGNLK